MNKKGVVFLDGEGRPYLLKELDGVPWLFYWHKDKHWVTLRRLKRGESFLYPGMLSQKEQDLYHEEHEKWELRHSYQKENSDDNH